MFLRLSFLVVLLYTSVRGQTQSGWHLSREKNNIKVYTKKGDSTSFKSIKVEGIFEGSWQKLFAILMDIGSLDQWVYRTTNAYLIRKTGDNEVLYYTETSLPWPVNNRDVIIRMKFYDDPVGKMHKVITTNEDGIVPLKKGLVRIPYYKAIWEVSTLEKNRIAITYYLDVQPGGDLPASMVNMFISSGPYETFANLTKLLRN